MRSISPFLWFDDNLGEAVDFYSSIFPDAKVHSIGRSEDGKVVSAEFELGGQRFNGLNGGPAFTFTEAISMFVLCDDQEEVDSFWDALTTDGGEGGQCGWLKDRFGLSWQIVPVQFTEMIGGGQPEQVQRVVAAMMTMRKMDVAALRAAYDG